MHTEFETHDEIAALMEETPIGDNHGRQSYEVGTMGANMDAVGRVRGMSVEDAKATEFLLDGGFGVVDTSAGTHNGGTMGARDAGMTAHRGVLFPGEYVDANLVAEKIAEMLGFSLADIRACYNRAGGPLPATLRAKRAEIDAALLALTAEDGNLSLLAEHLGVNRDTLYVAINRAKTAQS